MVRQVLIVSSQVRSVHSGVGTYAAMILRGLLQLPRDTAQWTVATFTDELPGADVGAELLDLGPRPRCDPTPGQFWTLGRRLERALHAAPRSFHVVHFLDAREGHAFVGSDCRGSATVIGTVHDDYAACLGWSPLQYRGKAADPLRRYVFQRWQKHVERRTYPRFDLLMTNSRATTESVQQAYGLDCGKLMEVSLTIEPEAPAVAPRELVGSPRLLFSGGNFYRKGLDVCVLALPHLRQTMPDVHLHVAGTCRSAAKIARLVARTGVGAQVTFHGRVPPDEMAAMLAGADVLVVPSRTEALGLVYLEAFRAGVPVVAGDRGGVTEIVKDRQSGVLVTPGSPEALANAVRMVCENEELRAQVIRGGREVLAARTPERLLHQTLLGYGLVLPRAAMRRGGAFVGVQGGMIPRACQRTSAPGSRTPSPS